MVSSITECHDKVLEWEVALNHSRDSLECAVLLNLLYWICSETALAATQNSGVAAATEW